MCLVSPSSKKSGHVYIKPVRVPLALRFISWQPRGQEVFCLVSAPEYHCLGGKPFAIISGVFVVGKFLHSSNTTACEIKICHGDHMQCIVVNGLWMSGVIALSFIGYSRLQTVNCLTVLCGCIVLTCTLQADVARSCKKWSSSSATTKKNGDVEKC